MGKIRTFKKKRDSEEPNFLQSQTNNNYWQSSSIANIQATPNSNKTSVDRHAQLQRARESNFDFSKMALRPTKSDYSIQRKTQLGRVGDKYEQDADEAGVEFARSISQNRSSIQTKNEQNQLFQTPPLTLNGNQSSSIQRVVTVFEDQSLDVAKQNRKQQLETEVKDKAPDNSTQNTEALIKEKFIKIYDGALDLYKYDNDIESFFLDEIMPIIRSEDMASQDAVGPLMGAIMSGWDWQAGPYDAYKLSNFIDFVNSLNTNQIYASNIELNQLQEESQQKIRKFYSHFNRNMEITENQGVITALSNTNTERVGHLFIYIEYLDSESDAIRPVTVMTDLTTDPYFRVNIDEDYQNNPRLDDFADSPYKRSWAVSMSQIEAAISKANLVQQELDNYTYSKSGTRFMSSVFGSKKSINCARYGNKILKAAGINAGFMAGYFKTPYKVATGKSYAGYKVGNIFKR